jgi:hypothetical protein
VRVSRRKLALDAGLRRAPRMTDAGRRHPRVADPGLSSALPALVEPDERGDPMSPLRWTTKSLRHLADPTAGARARCSDRWLRENEFSAKNRTHRSRTRRRSSLSE